MRNPILERLMARILPGHGYVLVVGRGDGKTLICATDNAGPRLTLINGASPLETQVRAVLTPHYKLLAQVLRERFRIYADDAFGLWVLADYSDVIEALEDYDPQSGERIRSGTLYVGDTAWVKGLNRGTVRGFRGERVLMRFAAGDASEGITTFVPRRLVKNIVRPQTAQSVAA